MTVTTIELAPDDAAMVYRKATGKFELSLPERADDDPVDQGEVLLVYLLRHVEDPELLAQVHTWINKVQAEMTDGDQTSPA